MKTETVTVNGKEWTKASIKELLQRNELACQRALMVIYGYQTADEQRNGETVHDNGMGFNGLDAYLLTSFAQQLQNRGFLSNKQMEILKKKMVKYAGQILKHMASQQEQAPEEEKPEEFEITPELEQKAQTALMRMNFAVWALQEGGSCGSERCFLYTEIDYNECYADKYVTEVTAELTVRAWNGERREYNIKYTQKVDEISRDDLIDYIKSIDNTIDLETTVDYYEMTYGHGLYDDLEPMLNQEPEKFEEYEE